MFPSYSDHLLCPRETDMAADYLQRWELKSDFVDILISVRYLFQQEDLQEIVTGTGRPTSLGQRGPVWPT
jgi:hypothetical protein